MSVPISSNANSSQQQQVPNQVNSAEQITRQAYLRFQSELTYKSAVGCLENFYRKFSEAEIANFDRHLKLLSAKDLDRAALKILELFQGKQIAHKAFSDRYWDCTAQVNRLVRLCSIASVDVVGYSVGRYLLDDTFLGQAIATCFLVDLCFTGILGAATSAQALTNKIRVCIWDFNLSVYLDYTLLLRQCVHTQKQCSRLQSLSSPLRPSDNHPVSANGSISQLSDERQRPAAQLTERQHNLFLRPSAEPPQPSRSPSVDETAKPIASTKTASELKNELQQATRERDLARSSELKCKLELEESQALVKVLQKQIANANSVQSKIGSLYRRYFCGGSKYEHTQVPQSANSDKKQKGTAPFTRGQISLNRLTV